MDTSFVDEMKEKLLAEQQQLQTDLDAVSSPDTGDNVPGARAPKFPDYGDDNYGENTASPGEVADFAENVNATGHLEGQRNAVEAALKRIEEGTYGTCIKCNTAIAEDRLRANPAADMCIHCAKAHVA